MWSLEIIKQMNKNASEEIDKMNEKEAKVIEEVDKDKQ